MSLFVVALIVLAVCAIVLIAIKRRGAGGGAGGGGNDDTPWPFYPKKPLTQPEQVLYHRLVSAMPGHIVLAQVQLSQVLGVKKGFNFYEWNNRINRMSLDFVVCLKDSTVMAAVELDDKTHEKASRVETDAKKEKALSDAGVTLIRWHVSSMPDENAIRGALVK